MIELRNYESADIEIHVRDKGLVLKEKSLIAFTQHDGKILAFGTEAEEIAAKNIDGVQVISPLRQGMIADYLVADRMFKHMIKKAWGKKLFSKPQRIAVCLPKGITEVEKKAFEDALMQPGVRELYISEVSLEKLKEGWAVTDEKRYAEFDIFIVISKDEPEKYISEELSSILNYAEEQGISPERVAELLKNSE